jgi:hypothetical protein
MSECVVRFYESGGKRTRLYRFCNMYKKYVRKAIAFFERNENIPFPSTYISQYREICGYLSGSLSVKT